MTKFGEVNCLVCGRVFAKKHPSHKYCHWQCQAAASRARRAVDDYSAEAVLSDRKADVDLMSFRQQSHEDNTPTHLLDGDDQPRQIPRGRYVYAWFNSESNLPFYVGKGVGDRAWRRHVHSDDGRSQFCQQLRSACSGFQVRIIRDNLTNEGAMLVESALISFVSSCGGFLANQVDPLRRMERPPLELFAAEMEP